VAIFGDLIEAAQAPVRQHRLLLWKVSAFLAALACVALIHSAIPFVAVPALQQPLWASGFAQSYANSGLFAIYATEFGQPRPAAIAFGLSGTFVQAMFLRIFGVAAIDAYTLMVVCYLGCGLYGAIALARWLGSEFPQSVLSGLLWLCLPIVWGHAAFSMLSLGFALLPLYAYSALRLIHPDRMVLRRGDALRFAALSIVAVFMDGYTFMMFVAMSAIVWVVALVRQPGARRYLSLGALPVIVLSFALAYFLYTQFVGISTFTPAPIAFFRGWGVDVTMLLIPTQGLHWAWDLLGWSVLRNEQIFWGDKSVLITTFALPLIIAGVAGYVVARNRNVAAALIVIALLGIYLSLGPSLKVNSTKEVAGITAEDSGALMPARYAVMPTGTRTLDEHVPGFSSMRASYRWLGMALVGLWGLTVIFLAWLGARRRAISYAVTVLLIVSFLPHVQSGMAGSIHRRDQVKTINTGILNDLRAVVGQGRSVMFAPHGNDLMAGYLAAVGGFRTYNIGGDKNLEMARATWSREMAALDAGHLDEPGYWRNIRSILLNGEVDIVVMPYFDLLLPNQVWPPLQPRIDAGRQQLLPIAKAAAASECFQLEEGRLFAAVSMSEAGKQAMRGVRTSEGQPDSRDAVLACMQTP
jgi:hypothetical protein